MREALVFNGAVHLDFHDIRCNVIRIPEVVIRLREAQDIWDTLTGRSFDLCNFISSEDASFLGAIKLKSLASAVVQVGLLDRHLKSHDLPEFVMGVSNGDSPLRVATGQMTFFDLVAESAAVQEASGERPRVGLTVVDSTAAEIPVLTGVQLVEHGVYQRRGADGVYSPFAMESREAERMLTDLVERHEVHRIVMVGPGQSYFGKRISELTACDVQVLESIDLDPMLSWFWSRLRDSRLAIAN